MRRAEPALCLAALLSGCSLAPTYQKPGIATPAAFKETPSGWTMATPAADAPPQSWWQSFNDPVLNDLEGRIETANPSLAAAVARYDQAVGQLRSARADLYPQIGVNGATSRDHVSQNRPLAAVPAKTYNLYQVGGSIDWEIDLFGRLRNQVKAGRAEAQASAADLRGVRLGLQVSLASSYFQMRGLDARAVLLDQTAAAFQRAYDLTETRHEGGVASGLDTSRARTQLASAKAELSDIKAQRAAYEHAIASLVGQPASSFAVPIDAHLVTPPSFATNTPATLLQRRPDIDAAERRVFAANARVGVARAAFFPTLSLGGSGGWQSTGPDLLSTASSFWALGPAAAALTIFDGGRRSAQVRIARAEFTEASEMYKKTVLTAFQEVEDDLARGRYQIVEERDQRDAAQSAERTRDLAMIRYRDGASDYLEVVTAQTAALDAERSLLDLHTRQLTTAVDSVRALGGVTAP